MTQPRRVAAALVVASLVGSCGARTSALVGDLAADAGPDSPGPDAAPWVEISTDCFCPDAELFLAHKDATLPFVTCGGGGRVGYLVGNCGDSSIAESVIVEYWAGDAVLGPDDPEAVRIESQNTTPGMPAHFGEWVVFEITPEESDVIHAHRDSTFLWIDPADLVPECDLPGLDNVRFDGISCPDPG